MTTLISRIATIACWAAIVAAAGCQRHGEAGQTKSNTASATGSLEIDSVPWLQAAVTSDTGGLGVGQVGWVVLTGPRQIMIADRAVPRLIVVDSAGRLVRALGREGTGPNEFKDPSWIGHCHGDSLFVWDRSLSRISVLTDSGEFARQFNMTSSPAILSCARSGILAGVVVTDPTFDPRMRADAPVTSGGLLIFDASGNLSGRIDSLSVLRNRPLGSMAQIAVGESSIAFGFPDTASVTLYQASGAESGSFAAGIGDRSPTEENYEAAVDEILSGLTKPSDRAPFRKQFLAIPKPRYMPAFRQLLIDPSRRVWVVVSAPGDSTTSIEVHEHTGGIVATFMIPGSIKVMDVRHGSFVGLKETPEGDQVVIAYAYH